MATRAVRRRSEQAVIYLRASPRRGFMAGAAVGIGGEVVAWLARSCDAVMATGAVRRRREQAVIYLRASPRGGFMARAAVGIGGEVVTWLARS